jgi:hypothetical protein
VECKGLRTTCRKCGIRFKWGDKTNPCPECGEVRNCGKPAVSGYGYCDLHGAPNPGHNYWGYGNLMTGNFASFPLTRLAAKKNEMIRDGQILSNRKSIDIIGRRVDELLERIDQNQAPDRLAVLFKLWEKYKTAQHKGDTLKELQAKSDLDDAFEAAYHDYAAWKQMFEALDLHRTMVESEVKIAKDMHAILSAEDAYELVADIFAVILRIEDNPKKLKRYQYELTRIIGEGSVIEAEASDPDDRDPGGPDPVDREEFLYSRDEE